MIRTLYNMCELYRVLCDVHYSFLSTTAVKCSEFRVMYSTASSRDLIRGNIVIGIGSNLALYCIVHYCIILHYHTYLLNSVISIGSLTLHSNNRSNNRSQLADQ